MPSIATALLAVAALVTAAPAAAATAGEREEPHEPRAPAEFVALSAVDPTIQQEIRYHSAHNFVGAPVDGYREPVCILTEDAARALHRAQRRLLARGYTLKVYDCYRPQRAVDHFVAWAKDPEDERMKGEFYPRVDKDRLFEDGYIAERSGHSRGSTVDATVVGLPVRPTRPYVPGEPLVDCAAPREERFPDNSLDMATGFDCFDTLSHTKDPRVRGERRANRMLLKNALEKAGFGNLPEEWWHFTFRPETFPRTHFDFPVSSGSLTG